MEKTRKHIDSLGVDKVPSDATKFPEELLPSRTAKTEGQVAIGAQRSAAARDGQGVKGWRDLIEGRRPKRTGTKANQFDSSGKRSKRRRRKKKN